MGKQRRTKDELLRDRSRDLRRPRNMAEAILWRELRGRHVAGCKFRRQHVVGPYVVDFYCAETQLVIKLDRFAHLEREAEDRMPQTWLETRGLKGIRCPNDQLDENLERQLEVIWEACRERTGSGQ